MIRLLLALHPKARRRTDGEEFAVLLLRGSFGNYTGQAPGFHCAASHSRSVSSLVRASCSRANSASVLLRTSV